MKTVLFTKERRTGITAKHLEKLQPDVNLAALPAELKYRSKRGLDALPAVDKHKSKKSKKSIGMTVHLQHHQSKDKDNLKQQHHLQHLLLAQKPLNFQELWKT